MVNKLKAQQIPAAHIINECISLCSSSVYNGSLHGIPQPSTPSKIERAWSVGIRGFRHLPELLNFSSLTSFLHNGGNNFVLSHFAKLGHIVWLISILQGPDTILHISWDGNSTVLLIHFGRYIEHRNGWTTAQHFGTCFKACNKCNLSWK